MLETAETVATTMGKKQAMKIRKIVGRSPMPNQRMANGIHASGERLRKKLIAGKKAARARTWRPNHNPAGTPEKTDSANPVVTRKSDATRSSTNLPLLASSTNALATASGEGKTDWGKTFSSDNADQIRSAANSTSTGRRRAFEGDISAFIVEQMDQISMSLQWQLPQ